mmetsp:Transcript_9498/g.12314  ORF Transcript_9498/g.12314 Transcript_9498/m.12314 type:complete len:98 (-) Transcript_9498:576-869(-)
MEWHHPKLANKVVNSNSLEDLVDTTFTETGASTYILKTVGISNNVNNLSLWLRIDAFGSTQPILKSRCCKTHRPLQLQSLMAQSLKENFHNGHMCVF